LCRPLKEGSQIVQAVSLSIFPPDSQIAQGDLRFSDSGIRSYLLFVLLFCCHTPAHEVLYRQVFLPSVPEGFEVRSTILGIDGPGDYLSDEFLRCIRAKLDLVVRSVEENLGDIIVWCDVNIRFFDLSPSALAAELESSASDVLFQRESPRMDDVNTGFFVCRCTPAALDFFTTVRSELESHPNENEQMVVNRLILNKEFGIRNSEFEMEKPIAGTSAANGKFGIEKPENEKRNSQIFWGCLPRRFYARTHGWPPPRHLEIYHANYTKGQDGVGQKLAQFREIAWMVRCGWFAWLLSMLRRIPGRIFHLDPKDD
jgi:hypothetical protein